MANCVFLKELRCYWQSFSHLRACWRLKSSKDTVISQTFIKSGPDAPETHPSSFLLLQGAIYGMAQAIPDRSIVSEISWGFLDCLYSTEDPQANRNHMNGNGKANWGGRSLRLALEQNAHRESNSPPNGSSELITRPLPYVATLNGRKRSKQKQSSASKHKPSWSFNRPVGDDLWPCDATIQGDWRNDWLRIQSGYVFLIYSFQGVLMCVWVCVCARCPTLLLPNVHFNSNVQLKRFLINRLATQ